MFVKFQRDGFRFFFFFSPASNWDLRIWSIVLDIWLLRHRYRSNVDQRIRCFDLCDGDDVQKSCDHHSVVYSFFEAVRFRVSRQILMKPCVTIRCKLNRPINWFCVSSARSSYIWSGLIVILGIYLNVYSRHKSAFDARIKIFFSRYFRLEKNRTISI